MRRFASGDQLNEVFGLAAGLDDRCLKQPCKQTLLTPHTLIPAGSVTKAFTGAATLRFVDKGVLGLDTLAHTLVDPVLARQGQPTMAELWAFHQFSGKLDEAPRFASLRLETRVFQVFRAQRFQREFAFQFRQFASGYQFCT